MKRTYTGDMATSGDKIREARRRAVLSQRELAKAAGLSQTTIGLIEVGLKQPRPLTIRKIAAAINVPATSLLGDAAEE